jgi:hypothetical protein
VRLRVGNHNDEHPHEQRNAFGVKWGEWIGPHECPLMRRWVIETPAGSARLHHFLKSDDTRALHNHPWWFVTFPLSPGGYVDVVPCPGCEEGYVYYKDGSFETCDLCMGGGRSQEHVQAWRLHYRKPGYTHAVLTDGCWTVIVTGRKLREWGFWLHARFFESRRYLRKFGYAPCED